MSGWAALDQLRPGGWWARLRCRWSGHDELELIGLAKDRQSVSWKVRRCRRCGRGSHEFF